MIKALLIIRIINFDKKQDQSYNKKILVLKKDVKIKIGFYLK